jgi:hypothetical protein
MPFTGARGLLVVAPGVAVRVNPELTRMESKKT